MRSEVLGLDLLGGDNPPETFIPALSALLEEAPFTRRLALFVTPSFLEHFRIGPFSAYLQHPALWLIPVNDSVQGHEQPLHAVRYKKESSMMHGMNMLRDRTLDTLLSIGNTGALVTAATLSLPLLPGVRRLGLLAYLQTRKNFTAVIDVGATVEPTVADLMKWTELGVQHVCDRKGITVPRVGLLNIGSETYKGTELQQAAYVQLCKYPGISFVGNVESEDVYQGAVDLLVTDGYSGNVFIKTSEAVRDFIYSHVLTHLERCDKENNYIKGKQNPFSGLFDSPSSQASCAYLLGTSHSLIKCHGALKASLLPSIVHSIWYMP